MTLTPMPPAGNPMVAPLHLCPLFREELDPRPERTPFYNSVWGASSAKYNIERVMRRARWSFRDACERLFGPHGYEEVMRPSMPYPPVPIASEMRQNA